MPLALEQFSHLAQDLGKLTGIPRGLEKLRVSVVPCGNGGLCNEPHVGAARAPAGHNHDGRSFTATFSIPCTLCPVASLAQSQAAMGILQDMVQSHRGGKSLVVSHSVERISVSCAPT